MVRLINVILVLTLHIFVIQGGSLTYAATWVNLEDIVSGEKSRSQKGRHHVIPPPTCALQSKSGRQKVEWWPPGAGERDKWGVIVSRVEFQFYKMNRHKRCVSLMETEGGDDRIASQMDLNPPGCARSNGSGSIFYITRISVKLKN